MTNKAEFFLGGEAAQIELEDMDYDAGTPLAAYSNVGTLIMDLMNDGPVMEAAYCLSCKEPWLDPEKLLGEIVLPRYGAIAIFPGGKIWGYVCQDCGISKTREEIMTGLVKELGGIPVESVTLVGGTA